nr:protein BatD [Bacteroidota bacterium]
MKINSLYKYFATTIILCALTVSIYAQQFNATINKTNAVVGEQLQISFTFNGQGKNFGQPDFKNFQVIAGPSQSSNMTIINGNMTSSQSLTYWIVPQKEGTFKIGPATITIDGKQIASNVITVSVGKGQQQQAQGNQRQQQQQNESGITSKNVFIKTSIDKSSLYRGEAMVVTYKLYTNVSLVNLIPTEQPSFNGFWNNDIKLPAQPNFVRETYNGTVYNAAVIYKAVLFPQQSGSLTIDPYKATVIARVQVKRNRNPNDPFDIFNDPFFGGGAQDVEYKVTGENIKVNVKELPPNAPASFDGAVGRLNYDVKLDKLQTKANEPLALKVKISGRGNLQLIDAPKINVPADIETYDPKVADNYSITEAGTNGSKTFEYLLIPRNEGEYIIDAIPFSYFDLETRTYRTSNAGPFKIKVLKGEGGAASISNSTATIANKAEVAVLGHDVRFIKTNMGEVLNINQLFYGSLKYYFLLLFPFALSIAAIFLKSRNTKLNSNITMVKSRGANKVATKRLALAGKLLTQNKNNEMYDEIYKAINTYVSDKFAIPISELTQDEMVSKLTLRKVNTTTIESLTGVLSRCEMARFASGAAADAQVVFNDAMNVITKIENETV